MRWLLRRDRVWAFGALAVAVAVAALAWFLLIGPQREETVGVEEQKAAAEGQIVVEQRNLQRLKADFAELDRFKEELSANRKALPTEAATGELLRELQSAGERAGVTVSSLAAGSPAELTGAPGVAEVTITIAAAGQLERLRAFLDEVQRAQPRAMLVFNVSFAPTAEGGPITGTGAQLTLSAQVFVALQQAATPTASPDPAVDD